VPPQDAFPGFIAERLGEAGRSHDIGEHEGLAGLLGRSAPIRRRLQRFVCRCRVELRAQPDELIPGRLQLQVGRVVVIHGP
jgi:hypothetical protein